MSLHRHEAGRSLRKGLLTACLLALGSGCKGLEATAPAKPPSAGAAGGLTAVAFVDGLRILGDASGRVRLDSETAPPRWLAAHSGPVRFVGRWSPSKHGEAGPWVYATASHDGTVAFFDEALNVVSRHRLPDAHLNAATAYGDRVAVAADRGLVAMFGPTGLVWSRTGLHGAAAYAVVFSIDGAELVAGGMDGHVSRLRVTDGVSLGEHPSGGAWITAMVHGVEGLYVGRADGSLQMVNPLDGVVLRELEPQNAAVRACLLTPTILVCGAEDGGLSACDRHTKAACTMLQTHAPVRALATARDQIVVAGADGRLRVYGAVGATLTLRQTEQPWDTTKTSND